MASTSKLCDHLEFELQDEKFTQLAKSMAILQAV